MSTLLVAAIFNILGYEIVMNWQTCAFESRK